MAVDLHPDIVRAIRSASHTRLGRRYDRYARSHYGIPGWKLAAKTVAGEFGGRSTRSGRGIVSSAGARGPAQFIPSTRQDFIERYGIDPWRSDAEAIKALEIHQLERGGLKGYNPGMPTYTNYILGQKLNRSDRRALRNGSGGAIDSAGGTTTLRFPGQTNVSLPKTTIPGQSFAAERDDARRQLLLGGDLSMQRLLDYKRTVNSLQDVPAKTVYGDLQVQQGSGKTVRLRNKGGGGGGKGPGGGAIFEAFYDPAGQYWDSGSIHKGAIGGHSDHVHVAGNEKYLVALGRRAQQMGLHVGENPAFGGVEPVHTQGSFHYGRKIGKLNVRAIDVSGDPKKMAAFYRMVLRAAKHGHGR